MADQSNGYEAIAREFFARRGSDSGSVMGAREVRAWAHELARGAAEIDLGCGPGLPLTKLLVNEGLQVYGVDASPSLVEVFRHNLPGVPVACESVEETLFFQRTFDGVLAWGLLFLLMPEAQRSLLRRIANILSPGGRLLFTAPAEAVAWKDAMTGLESRSLGSAEYRRLLSAAGVTVGQEYEDEGQNHYFACSKRTEMD